MNVGDLKKLLDSCPDDLELFVDVPTIEPEDCGEMPISRLSISIGLKGQRGVIEIESPYI